MDKNLHIYYFSGTGNSIRVAQKIAGNAEELGYTSRIIDIATINRKKPELPDENTLIGFVSPTHGFNYPPIMMHFLFRFPKAKRHKVFFVNTRAGMKMGKLFLPGLSGIAQYFYAILFVVKRYKVVGMQCIDLPSNWISIHPGLKPTVIQSIVHRCDNVIDRFSAKILTKKNSYRALRDIIQDLLITPVSILYYLIGRFFFAKSFYADKNCTKCYACKNTCPVHAITVVDNRPYWTLNCESCMHCMNICPERSIQTAHGFIAGIIFLVWTAVVYFLYGWMQNHSEIELINSMAHSKSFRFIVTNTLILSALFIGYKVLHFLLKFGAFERLIRYTSFTFFKRWRRYNPRFRT